MMLLAYAIEGKEVIQVLVLIFDNLLKNIGDLKWQLFEWFCAFSKPMWILLKLFRTLNPYVAGQHKPKKKFLALLNIWNVQVNWKHNFLSKKAKKVKYGKNVKRHFRTISLKVHIVKIVSTPIHSVMSHIIWKDPLWQDKMFGSENFQKIVT